jgi:thiol-disulfide isomerase/thioredoxin
MKKEFSNINTYLVIALVIVVGIGLYFTLSVPGPKEAPKPIPPREVTVTVLNGCEECFDVSSATDFLKQQKNLNITSIKELGLEDAKAEASKYGISKLPAVLITGDIANLTVQNFAAKEGALVFDQSPPPYYDVATGNVKGRVTVTILSDKTCEDCFSMDQVIGQLKQNGINLASETKVDSKSTEGKQLISKYKIERVPTLIFSKDALEYDVVKQVWSQVGSEESDGTLVLRLVSPPYINVSTGKTEGMVDLTIITDNSCSYCFNASVLKDLFAQSFGMAFKKTKNVDISSTEGKSLAKKYGIELVPTVVLSKDAGAYPNIAQAWAQVGTVEKDGTFVFKNVGLLQDYFAQTGEQFGYKNTTSGETLPKAASTEAEVTAPTAE